MAGQMRQIKQSCRPPFGRPPGAGTIHTKGAGARVNEPGALARDGSIPWASCAQPKITGGTRRGKGAGCGTGRICCTANVTT